MGNHGMPKAALARMRNSALRIDGAKLSLAPGGGEPRVPPVAGAKPTGWPFLHFAFYILNSDLAPFALVKSANRPSLRP